MEEYIEETIEKTRRFWDMKQEHPKEEQIMLCELIKQEIINEIIESDIIGDGKDEEFDEDFGNDEDNDEEEEREKDNNDEEEAELPPAEDTKPKIFKKKTIQIKKPKIKMED